MNTMENNDTPTSLVDYAVALAAAHCEGCEQRCRRWRRRAAVRRCVALVLLTVATVILAVNVNGALAKRPLATGVLSTPDAVADAHQMLQNL